MKYFPGAAALGLSFFQVVVAWAARTFLVLDSPAPAAIGEVLGERGQYSLAFFPYNSAYGLGGFAAYASLFVFSLLRLGLEDVWEGGERAALDNGDFEAGEILMLFMLFLTAFCYPAAICIPLEGVRGVAAAFTLAALLLVGALLGVIGLLLMQSYSRRSGAALLFAEFTWAPFVACVTYCVGVGAGVFVVRARRDPDPDYTVKLQLLRNLSAAELEKLEEQQAEASEFSSAASRALAARLRRMQLRSPERGAVVLGQPLLKVGAGVEQDRPASGSDAVRQQALRKFTVPFQRYRSDWKVDRIGDATNINFAELPLGIVLPALVAITVTLAVPSPVFGAVTLLPYSLLIIHTSPEKTIAQALLGLATLGAVASGVATWFG
jgi:hypothetical protein